MKKVLVQFNFPNMSSATYDKAWEELRKTGNDNPQGLLYHAGAQQGKNWVVVDVWESAEAFARFGKILVPLLKKIGVPNVEPTILPVHYLYVSESLAVH